ncbi:hypothetical protein [Jongsikchunia kroppenstedtii]|uniref:hypothetical protein n=1 Tax=Jongsikchunia kroppenstedtii TaxID=1121721 RepID=UPI0012DBE535|nr:hypothetical protein [Jongsikchunia kroppenstedtii]
MPPFRRNLLRGLIAGVCAAVAVPAAWSAPAGADVISDVAHAPNGAVAIARGMTMLHTNDFGIYGCEDFVDAAYGLTTATGIPHDGAIAYYQNLAAHGQGHSSLPAPVGALVFSRGPDGGHVDISLGEGHYLSGGVQGFAPGWGDGTDIQILPSANLGAWQLVGWAYAPWSAVSLGSS